MARALPAVLLGACSRLLHGLWQTSGGWGDAPRAAAVAALVKAHAAGYVTLDVADHYGPAEDLAGEVRRALAPGAAAELRVFTKWCPRPGPVSRADVDAALRRSLSRLGVERIDLLQFHWWSYELRDEMLGALRLLAADARVGKLGLTNFDTAHVRLFLDEGLPIVSNQVQFSLLDPRPLAAMAPLCAARGVGLLTYGTLAGGLLTDHWLGRPEPDARALPTPSLRKYFGILRAAGGWPHLQRLLAAARAVADRHGVTIALVALRWVLEQPAVAGVIVGLRAGVAEHADDNARVFGFSLTPEDAAQLAAAQGDARARLVATIGDCGDEYRG